MNAFLDERFVEVVHRLALGIETIDAGTARPVQRALAAEFHDTRAGARPLRASRRDSGRWALLHDAGVGPAADVLLADARRRFVPRLLRYPIPVPAAADASPPGHRIRRPLLFPGAAYDAGLTGTGLRGRVERGGEPARWVRVEARLAAGNGLGPVIARAHGDERGEFLLLVGPDAAAGAELPATIRVRLTVRARPSEPTPADPHLPLRDPLWDLPREDAPAPGVDDAVSSGAVAPASHTSTLARDVDLVPGLVRSDEPVFAFPAA